MRLNTELNPATSGDVNTNLGLVYGELPKKYMLVIPLN